jgi:hypothetical protein
MPGTEQPELSLERFSALVEAYGGELSRFPERERAAAKELLRSSREAQQLLAAASVFDSLLASAKLDLPSPELERELAQIPARFPQQRSKLRLLPFRTPARAGLAAAAAVLLGLLGGQLNPVDAPSTDSNDSLSTGDQADIAALTFADGLFDDLTTDQGDAE